MCCLSSHLLLLFLHNSQQFCTLLLIHSSDISRTPYLPAGSFATITCASTPLTGREDSSTASPA